MWTTAALVAMLSDEPMCDTCSGHGRIEVTGPRDKRVCPACGGLGIPRTTRHIVRTHLRQIARETRA